MHRWHTHLPPLRDVETLLFSLIESSLKSPFLPCGLDTRNGFLL